MHSKATAIPDDLMGEDASVQRWRNAILRLSDAMVSAAEERADLSPLLLEALSNALENLLLYGDESDLEALEEWLDDGDFAPHPSPAVSVASYSLFGRREETYPMHETESQFERRAASERRAVSERRGETERRNAPPGEYLHEEEKRRSQRRASQRRVKRDRRA